MSASEASVLYSMEWQTIVRKCLFLSSLTLLAYNLLTFKDIQIEQLKILENMQMQIDILNKKRSLENEFGNYILKIAKNAFQILTPRSLQKIFESTSPKNNEPSISLFDAKQNENENETENSEEKNAKKKRKRGRPRKNKKKKTFSFHALTQS